VQGARSESAYSAFPVCCLCATLNTRCWVGEEPRAHFKNTLKRKRACSVDLLNTGECKNRRPEPSRRRKACSCAAVPEVLVPWPAPACSQPLWLPSRLLSSSIFPFCDSPFLLCCLRAMGRGERPREGRCVLGSRACEPGRGRRAVLLLLALPGWSTLGRAGFFQGFSDLKHSACRALLWIFAFQSKSSRWGRSPLCCGWAAPAVGLPATRGEWEPVWDGGENWAVLGTS